MAPLRPAGYSARPLAEKLGYRASQHALFVALPPGLGGLAAAVEFASVERVPTWSFEVPAQRFDLIHAFTVRRSELDRLAAFQQALNPTGMIWVSWPKKSSRVATDVSEDAIRAAALALDLVDIKVAAVDAIWSGLKLVIRKERR